MAKSLLDKFVDSILDDEWKGKRGEKLTERELKLVSLFGRKGMTLRNVYVPKENGETSEIDLIYITQKGIFVFESKNYSGWIFGDEKSQFWTAMLPNKEKNRFYNPIKQNKTHLKWLGNYIGEDVPLFSVIVFSERCELKKIDVETPEIKVIKRDRTYATVRDIWDKTNDALDAEQITRLYEKLKELTNVDKATKAAHIDSIGKRFSEKPDEMKQDNEEKTNDGNSEEKICPKCGQKLVLRTAKKGENAGKRFYGCSGFPKCRYIENID